ncbi:MAG TPA: GntR family transcriptional regulator [Anaerolineaceae bacterium]
MNLADQAYQAIRAEILSTRLMPGQQIQQGQLAEKYSLGMTPVRDALQRLAHEGLVQAVPRTGYIVSSITFSDVRELYEIRGLLEIAAVRLVVARATDSQLSALAEQANFSYVYSDHEDYSRFLERNKEFHCAVAALAGNRRLTETLERTLDGLTRVFHFGLDLRDSADEMRSEHLTLVDALLRRDADAAAEITSSQISRSIQRVMEALSRTMDIGLAAENGHGFQNVLFGETKS